MRNSTTRIKLIGVLKLYVAMLLIDFIVRQCKMAKFCEGLLYRDEKNLKKYVTNVRWVCDSFVFGTKVPSNLLSIATAYSPSSNILTIVNTLLSHREWR